MMYDVQLQLQASGGSNDTQMCHRFVNFETIDFDHHEGQIQASINDYLRVLTQAEGTAILYSKSHSELQKDARLANPSDRERSWTICVVYNPKRNQKVEQAIRA